MYFVSLILALRTKGDYAPLSFSESIHAHAAILKAITKRNGELGRKLHDMQRNKWMTLAFVDVEENQSKLRVSFMGPEGLTCTNELVNSLLGDPILKFGSEAYEVVSVDLSHPEWGATRTWADLHTTIASPSMRFSFRTPTAITKVGAQSTRYMELLPRPEDVFAGLLRKWVGLEGPKLPESLSAYLQTGGCVVSDHCVQTITLHTRERVQKGFLGTVIYLCRTRDEECVAALNALARFAFFAGVGYQTARGMGAVQVRIGLEAP